MKPVSSACTHVHTYMGGGGYYFFHRRSFIPPGALKDGLQSVCTWGRRRREATLDCMDATLRVEGEAVGSHTD